MKFKNVYLFHRTNMKNGYLLASLHWRWSITWRWALWLQFTKKLRPFYGYSKSFSGNYLIILHLPCMLFTFQTQQNLRRGPKHWKYPIEELINEMGEL